MIRLLSFATVLLLLPSLAHAAVAVVKVDTGGTPVNAVEGVLIIPDGMEISDIRTGNSAVLMWAATPIRDDNRIRFAGITPGGFVGEVALFTVAGAFTIRDLERVTFESVQALADDGVATPVPVDISLSLREAVPDLTVPDSFTPLIATDPALFDGKAFLSFAAQDKQTGIDHYEVREGKWGWFKRAESPYLLSNQRLDADIYVRAVDKAGNERIEVVVAQLPWWERHALLGILIVAILVVVLLNFLWARFAHSRSLRSS